MISSVLSAASGKRTSFASSCDRGVGPLLMQEFRFGCPFGAMGAVMFGGLLSEREGGYSSFSTIEFDADDKKSLFRESRTQFMLYLQQKYP